MLDVSRRNFILKASSVFVAATVLKSPLFLRDTPLDSGLYRIAPIDGVEYSDGFLELCESRSFSSAQDALMSIRNEDLEFKIVKKNISG